MAAEPVIEIGEAFITSTREVVDDAGADEGSGVPSERALRELRLIACRSFVIT